MFFYVVAVILYAHVCIFLYLFFPYTFLYKGLEHLQELVSVPGRGGVPGTSRPWIPRDDYPFFPFMS